MEVSKMNNNRSVKYRDLLMECRNSRVNDVEISYNEEKGIITGFCINWCSIGDVAVEKAEQFANDIVFAANKARELNDKYTGLEVDFR